MKFVQVFIPTFNRRYMLEKAIASVLCQTYPYVEVVVLDNASTDQTQDFMEKIFSHDTRVAYHRNPSNIGMTNNFNLIGSLVSKAYFSVLTDDDVYESHFIETAIGLFEKYPSAAFVGTNAPILKNGQIVNVMLAKWSEGFHEKGKKVKECSQSQHPLFTHCLFKASLAPEFVFHDTIRMVADGFLLTCLATKYDMAISKTITGYWNLHGENATEKQEKEPNSYITALIQLYNLYADFCNENQLTNKLSGYYRKKLLVGLLQVGKDKACFQEVIQRPDVRKIFNPLQCQIINILRLIRFLNFCLFTKAQLRKIRIVW